MKDRVVVVTGAAGTIGREVSRVLVANGARLALTDVSAGPLETLMEELEGTAGTVWGRAGDAADFGEFSRLVADATEVLGLSLIHI